MILRKNTAMLPKNTAMLPKDTWGIVIANLDLPEIHSLLMTCMCYRKDARLITRARAIIAHMHIVKDNPLCLETTPDNLLTQVVVSAGLRRYPDAVMQLFLNVSKRRFGRSTITFEAPSDAPVICRCSWEVLSAAADVLAENMYMCASVDQFVKSTSIVFGSNRTFNYKFYYAALDWNKISGNNIPQSAMTVEFCTRALKGPYGYNTHSSVPLAIPKHLWTHEIIALRMMRDRLSPDSAISMVGFILTDSELAFKLAPMLCQLAHKFKIDVKWTRPYMTREWYEGLAMCYGSCVFNILPRECLNAEVFAVLIESGHEINFDTSRCRTELRQRLISRGRLTGLHLQTALKKIGK